MIEIELPGGIVLFEPAVGASLMALAAVTGFVEYFAASFLEAGMMRGRKKAQAAFGGIKALWVTAAALSGVSLPFFFLGFGLIHILKVAFAHHIGRRRMQLYSILSFLLFSTLLLIFGGSASLLAGRNIRELWGCMLFRICLPAVVQILIGFLLLVIKKVDLSLLEPVHEQKQDRFLNLFLWSCIVYVFIDSIFLMIPSSGLLVAILLTSGNFLILLILFIIYFQKWKIAQKRNLEEEYAQLAAERAKEQLIKAQLNRSAQRDSLTNCYSRWYLYQELEKLRKANTRFTIVFADLDRLKEINDRYGHEAGDRYLMGFARRMQEMMPPGCLLARVGGDEFVAAFTGYSKEETLVHMERIRAAFANGSADNKVLFSFGVASGDGDIEQIIKQADSSMYLDKRRDRKGGGG